VNVILDLDKLSYTTLERLARDYGYEEDVDKVVNKLEEDTNRFKEELKETIMNVFKSIKIDIIK
jgi:hypothetical protein